VTRFDLVFCAPSGTRTPNPLRSVAAFSVASATVLIGRLTWANALWLGLRLTRCFAGFRGDGRGINRGLGSRARTPAPSVHSSSSRSSRRRQPM
jgi:hypothetical protein